VYATIANDGKRVTPSLIDSVTAPDGTVTPGATPEETVVVSPKTAKTVLAMLENDEPPPPPPPSSPEGMPSPPAPPPPT
jgi:membrane peptidoglycan carboxypeptidase